MKKTALFIYVTIAAAICVRSNAATPRQEAPIKSSLLLLNSEWLIQSKKRIASGNHSLAPAFAKLQKDAESALDDSPFSVMDKILSPPSGDKHDYISLAPCWWPNPKKKDGLPYIRRDGQVNPASRTNATDAQRLLKMANTVQTLTLAYYFTEDEKYARRAALLLKTWFLNPDTKMNPHLNYGEAIPGSVEGSCSGIIRTRHLTMVVDSAILLTDSSAWSAEDHKRLGAWFEAYLHWLLNSKFGKEESSSQNNHGTWYDVQLADFALFIGEKEFARKVLESVKSRRIATQTLPDGRQPYEVYRSLSFNYSIMNLTGMFALARLAEHVGVDLWNFQTSDKAGISGALDYLASYIGSNYNWPHKQIREFNYLQLFPLLRQAAIVYKAPEYEEMIKQLPINKVRRHRYQLLCPAWPTQPSASANVEKSSR